jgi:hypothetical protein
VEATVSNGGGGADFTARGVRRGGVGSLPSSMAFRWSTTITAGWKARWHARMGSFRWVVCCACAGSVCGAANIQHKGRNLEHHQIAT